MVTTNKPANKTKIRVGKQRFKVGRTQVVLLVGLVVLVGAAVAYRSFAGSNARYVPKNVANLAGWGRAVQMSPYGSAGYTLDGHGGLHPFAVGTGSVPINPYTEYYSSADTARDFVILDWSSLAGLVLTNNGQLHRVGNYHAVKIGTAGSNPVTTARKIIMYDSQRGYILDGAGRFIPFSIDGASLPPAVNGFAPRIGKDVVRSAVINPNKHNGYLVAADGVIYGFGIGGYGPPPGITAGTVWASTDKAIGLTITNWTTRQGYVIASNGGWYSFNGAPNNYTGKNGAPFNFGTNIRDVSIVPNFAGFEMSKNGTIFVFSLPNYLVAQNNKEIYPPTAKNTFKLGPQLAYGYYQMPAAPNGEYDFYNPNVAPFNGQYTPDKAGTPPNERCGRADLLNMVYKVSTQWEAKYGADGSRLNVGDMNAAGHISHSNGIDVDLRVSNNSAANVANAQRYTYLRERSVQLAKWLIDSGARQIYYNDTAIYGEVNAYGRSKGLSGNVMDYYNLHDDHFHVRIGGAQVAGNALALPATSGCP